MNHYVALGVSLEVTAICVVDETGRIVAARKMSTCPETIVGYLKKRSPNLVRLGMKTGPLAVWLWNDLHDRGLPIVSLDARHANAALKMGPNKTDRNDAVGLAQIVCAGWFKQVRIKTRKGYQVRASLSTREVLVHSRVKLENEIRGFLHTFGVLFRKTVGRFSRRADEIIADDLAKSPELRLIIESLVRARTAIIEQINILDRHVHATVKVNPVTRLFVTAPGVDLITAPSVTSAFDGGHRFPRSASAGAYLGLTPRRYESGKIAFMRPQERSQRAGLELAVAEDFRGSQCRSRSTPSKISDFRRKRADRNRGKGIAVKVAAETAARRIAISGNGACGLPDGCLSQSTQTKSRRARTSVSSPPLDGCDEPGILGTSSR